MKTTKLLIIVFSVALIGGLLSCEYAGFQKTKGGMPYKIFHGKGEKPVKVGAFLKYHIINKLNDSILFDSHTGIPGYFRVDGNQQPYNITEILLSLKKGDSVYAVQMVDSLLKENPMGLPPQFKKGDRLITLLTVLDVIDSVDAYTADQNKEQELKAKSEIQDIENYLSKKNIKTQKTASGSFVEILEPGSGDLAEPGSHVSVKYTGTTFDGTTFDSNIDTSFHHTEPLEFTIGSRQMVNGFDEGIRALNKGAKARIYIPSIQAFGANPGQGSKLKPYDNVIFYVEVLDVTPKPESTLDQK